MSSVETTAKPLNEKWTGEISHVFPGLKDRKVQQVPMFPDQPSQKNNGNREEMTQGI